MNLNEYLLNMNKNMDDYLLWVITRFAMIFSKQILLFYLYVSVLTISLVFLSHSLIRYKETVLCENNLRLQKIPFPIKPIPFSGQECPIAHDEIPKNENCYILYCGHTFGEGIVQWWDNGNRICPMCRRVIKIDFW